MGRALLGRRRDGSPRPVRLQPLLGQRAQVPSRQVDDYLSKERMQFSRRYVETLGKVDHEILIEEDTPSVLSPPKPFPPCWKH